MSQLNRIRNGAIVAASLAALSLPAQADRGRDVYGNGYGGAVVHADAGYRGSTLQVGGVVPDLARVRFNDRISSISIHSGVWEVCTDANFRGKCATIDTSVARLGDLRLNDNISSIRPVGPGRARGGPRGRSADVVLFSGEDLRGEAFEPDGDMANLSDYRFNDKASSILVTRGTWLACEHANYRGRCEVISRGSGDLRPIGLNNNISSIRRHDRRHEARRDHGRYDWRN
ncbi:beta/gamma crystallin-related protein [Hyphomonas sp.]|uniref:beta/gamma crystallin-related protein n=1 Tax=Hyphomonas sp. TaxID=87 RepID=UPI003D29DA92